MFNKDLVKREDFANTNSYNVAIWGGEVCNKILITQHENNQFFFENAPIAVHFEFDYKEFKIYLKSEEHPRIVFIGDQHQEVDYLWKVWCTKKELTEFFKGFKFIPKAQFKSIL